MNRRSDGLHVPFEEIKGFIRIFSEIKYFLFKKTRKIHSKYKEGKRKFFIIFVSIRNENAKNGVR